MKLHPNQERVSGTEQGNANSVLRTYCSVSYVLFSTAARLEFQDAALPEERRGGAFRLCAGSFAMMHAARACRRARCSTKKYSAARTHVPTSASDMLGACYWLPRPPDVAASASATKTEILPYWAVRRACGREACGPSTGAYDRGQGFGAMGSSGIRSRATSAWQM